MEPQLQKRILALAQEFEADGAFAVYEGDVCHVRCTFGFSDHERATPVTQQDTYGVSLHSQFILSLLLHRLNEQGALCLYEDTLGRFLPEYQAGRDIPLWYLLAGLAGLPSHTSAQRRMLDADPVHQALPEGERFAAEQQLLWKDLSYPALLDLIAPLPPRLAPGNEEEDYFTATDGALLAEVLRRVSGLTLFELAQKELFAPLGIDAAPGLCASCASYGMLDRRLRIPLAAMDCPDCATIGFAGLERLGRAMAQGRILTKASWKKALNFGRFGTSPGFENNNGMALAFASGPLGYNICLYFDLKRQLYVVSACAGEQKQICQNGRWGSFRSLARREWEGLFQVFSAPRMKRVGHDTIWDVMDLTVDPSQESFVMPAKDSLAYAGIERSWKPYALVDGGRVVGLLCLQIKPQDSLYAIEIILIDRRFQGKGYGRFMVRWAVDRLKRAGATRLEIGVNRSNPVARRLYESVGFRPTEVYQNGMTLALDLGDAPQT